MQDIKVEEVKKLYKQYKNKLTTANKMYNYYIGNTDIDSTYKKSKLGNNRIIKANYIKKFINEEIAFAVGNPITYTKINTIEDIIENKKQDTNNIETALIENIMNKNNSNVDAELMKNLLVFGEAMELYYIKNDNFYIKELSPLNCYCSLNENGEVIEAIYVYKIEKQQYIQYFNKDGVTTFDKDYKKIDNKNSYFDTAAIAYANLIDGVNNTLYNDLKSLQDNFENILSDFSNEIGDSRLSYLILKNFQLSEEEEVEIENLVDAKAKQLEGTTQAYTAEMVEAIKAQKKAERIIENFKENGILLIDDDKDNKAEGKYLIKEINPEIHSKMLKNLQDIIYQIAQHINLNEQQSSNTSGVALLTRIIALRNKIKMQQNCMDKIIKNRIKNMFIFLNKRYKTDLKASCIQTKYTINVPSDDSAMADIITKLVPQGIMSATTGLAQLSFITNPSLEVEKARKEQEELILGARKENEL